MPADPQHHVARIGAALCHLPLPQLMGKIGRWLSGKGGVGRSHTLPGVAVAGGAGLQSAGRIALLPQDGRWSGARAALRLERHGGIIGGDRKLFRLPELLRDPAHLRVLPPTIGIGAHLPIEVAGIKARQPRRSRAVAATVQPMTGKACIRRARSGTAQGNQFAARREPAMRRVVDICAGRHSRQQHGGQRPLEESGAGHAGGTAPSADRFHRAGFRVATAAALMLMAGCKPPPDERHQMPEASAARGRETIARAGCTSCHTVPGIRWPQGQVGPSLHGFAASNLISGRLPNRPDILAAYVANAPAVLPGTTMPAMPINREEARDVAAYLYTLKP